MNRTRNQITYAQAGDLMVMILVPIRGRMGHVPGNQKLKIGTVFGAGTARINVGIVSLNCDFPSKRDFNFVCTVTESDGVKFGQDGGQCRMSIEKYCFF